MRERDPIDADDLGRYWDGLVAGGAAGAAPGDDLAETVRRLDALGRRVGPDPTFVARLERELRRGADRPAPLAPGAVAPNGRAPRSGIVAAALERRPRRGEPWTHLAVAAV